MEEQRQEQGGEGERRRELDRVDGCLMVGLGVPVLVIVVAGMLSVVWGWGTVGPAALWAKWVVTGMILVGVGGAMLRLLKVRR